MKQLNSPIKYVSLLALLFSLNTIFADTCEPTPTLKCYTRRSDSMHKPVLISGAPAAITRPSDNDELYTHFSAAPGVRFSFASNDIAQCLFGDDLIDECCKENRVIAIQGSAIARRNSKAWLADYFYLPRNFDGLISIEPQIRTFFCDLDLYVGLDNFACGLYARVHGPVVHSRWDLKFCERSSTDGVPLYHQNGYFSPAMYEGTKLLQTFTSYMQGGTPDASDNNPTFQADTLVNNRDVVFTPLKYAKMSQCSRSETGFADLRFELGWNFWQSDCYHVGLNIQGAAPTGKKKRACFLFDSMIGNGNHWEVGGGLTAHYVAWTSEDQKKSVSLHFDANLTHMFENTQKRTFDLRNKPNSAYMLAARFGENPADSDQIVSSTVTAALNASPPVDTVTVQTKQFALEYQPIANLSTINVKVSVPVHADVSLMLNYRCGQTSWDWGYNFWARSCENLSCAKACTDGSILDPAQKNSWGLKGDARMFGYSNPDGMGSAPLVNYAVIPLSATQSSADIRQGSNQIALANVVNRADAVSAGILIPNATTVDNEIDNNSNIDNREFAYQGPAATAAGAFNNPTAAAAATSSNFVQTSNGPVLLNQNNLSYARAKSSSHTFFSSMSYEWNGECWSPYIGFGKAVEWGTTDDCTSSSSSEKSKDSLCGPCRSCAVSQWSIWIKGGVSF